MILHKLSNPSSLSSSNILGLSEIFQVLVVGMDFKRFVCAYQVISPFFEGWNNGEHFLVINLVIALSLVERFGEICDGVPFS